MKKFQPKWFLFVAAAGLAGCSSGFSTTPDPDGFEDVADLLQATPFAAMSAAEVPTSGTAEMTGHAYVDTSDIERVHANASMTVDFGTSEVTGSVSNAELWEYEEDFVAEFDGSLTVAATLSQGALSGTLTGELTGEADGEEIVVTSDLSMDGALGTVGDDMALLGGLNGVLEIQPVGADFIQPLMVEGEFFVKE